MKHLLSLFAALLVMTLATACHEGQGGASASTSSDSADNVTRPELLVVYFYDGGDEQSMGEDVLSAFDELKERFGDRIALWAIDSSINTDLFMQFDPQDLPAAMFVTNTDVPLYELSVDNSLSGDIDRETLTKTAIGYLDPQGAAQ